MVNSRLYGKVFFFPSPIHFDFLNGETQTSKSFKFEHETRRPALRRSDITHKCKQTNLDKNAKILQKSIPRQLCNKT